MVRTSENNRQMSNIILFRKGSLKKAYNAGIRAALADPSNMQDVFEAGEKRGSGWLNEASNAPNFFEFMVPRREKSPGSFNYWYGQSEKELSITLDEERFELAAAEIKMEMEVGKKLITMEAIENAIRIVFNTTIDDLRYLNKRTNAITKPRFFAYYIGYHHLIQNLADMGDRWGGRHHATVMHGAGVTYQEASQYSEEKDKLILLYRNMARNGYNINYFVQDDKVPSKGGHNRTVIKRVNLNL